MARIQLKESEQLYFSDLKVGELFITSSQNDVGIKVELKNHPTIRAITLAGNDTWGGESNFAVKRISLKDLEDIV